MIFIWTALAALVIIAGIRYRARLLGQRERTPRVDDEAVRRIIAEGRLEQERDAGRLDRQAAAEAEEEFWSEYWDEPDEYRP